MGLTPLNYATPATSPSNRRWRWGVQTAAGILVFLLLPFPAMTDREVECRIDPVTGSMAWKTILPFGITTNQRLDVSPLEMRLKKSGLQWTPSWRFFHSNGLNIFGRTISAACGTEPPINQLRPVMKEFVDASTDAELREFVRVMQSGTEAEQKAAVEAAGEKGREALSAGEPN